MPTLFISDLHLENSRPQITALFLQFLATYATKAKAVYILGDLFEAWLGDDDQTPLNQTVINALRNLSTNGVPLYFMHGNRDFLIGQQFAQQSGCTILSDPCLIDLYGTQTLLMHGDTLCTADVKYLQARAKYRQSFYRKLFLAAPLTLRRWITRRLRQASHQHTSTVNTELMDAALDEIKRMMTLHQASLLIHGHTHRPSIEHFTLDGQLVSRIVLGDWDKTGNVLICDEDGTQRLIQLQPA